jgi:malate synthase
LQHAALQRRTVEADGGMKFEFAQDYLGEQNGTFKATVLIETITASFQLDEIIYIRDHIVGLTADDGIIFSLTLKNYEIILYCSNRDQVTMTSPFMSAYSTGDSKMSQTLHSRYRWYGSDSDKK